MDISTTMFIVALSTIVRIEKPPKCPTMNEFNKSRICEICNNKSRWNCAVYWDLYRAGG